MPEYLTITNLTGDLTIDPPDNSIVIHSVNCLGQWGSGVALALAEALPGAYRVYQDFCKRGPPETLLGFALLISPQKEDYDLTPKADGSPTRSRRYVWCLFVSEGYGRRTKTKPGKSKPADIMRHTKSALEQVKSVLSMGQQGKLTEPWDENAEDLDDDGNKPDIGVIWVCKFNSGSFGIKWETTLDMIKDIFGVRNGEVWEGEIRVVAHD